MGRPAVKKTLCIVGGGPGGVGLAWALAQQPSVAEQWSITIIHDEDDVGGHCATYPVTNPVTGAKIPVDIGVQCVAPLINPNVSLMLGAAPFLTSAPVVDAGPLKMACAFPPRNGQPMNWGNFPAYQQGPLFALYSETGMVPDCRQLQDFIRSFFDFDLQWTPDPLLPRPSGDPGTPPPLPMDGPSIFTAIQEQLGLKLESQRGPVDVLVIDRAELPTEN